MRTLRTLPRLMAGALSVALSVALLPLSGSHAAPRVVCTDVERDIFSDVSPTSTHAANIDCAAAYGITLGVGGGNYNPSGTVSRAQMASFLVRFHEVATDVPQMPAATSPFTDITSKTHAGNIRIAAALGITVGRTPTTYEPSVPVTRAQMATFVARTLRSAGADLGAGAPDHFTDDNGSEHEANINALAANGIVTGIGNSRYAPSRSVTRAQMATFLANAAGLLADQGRWFADPLSVERPEVILVAPVGDATDVIDVHWNAAVTSAPTGAEFRVTAAAGTPIVARGGAASRPSTTVVRVTLDGPLVPAEIYWLEIAGGVATDADGHTNREQRIAFTFSLVDGGGTDGGTDPGAEPIVAPAITSIVTQPSTARLIVTFDRPVHCPDTAAGRAAWFFTNNSVIESGTHAGGSPTAVFAPATPSTTCELGYSVQGVENGDFGTMSYTPPSSGSDQVRTSSGGSLSSLDGFRVSDSVAPTFEGVNASASTQRLVLQFSEPILCLSLQTSDFDVYVEDPIRPIAIADIICDGAIPNPTLQLGPGVLSSGDQVRVTLVGNIFDESQDNTVALTFRRSFAL